MSKLTRDILTVGLTILMALSSFAAGYVVNDYVEQRVGASHAGNLALFEEAWQLIDNNFIGEKPTEQQKTYAAIRGAVALLNDPYTVFIEPQVRAQEIESLRGNFGGVGATLMRHEEGGDLILSPIPNNPAENAGILDGDILVAVDGTPITPDMPVSEIADLVRGEKGTTVVLTVIHPDTTDPVDIPIERGDILIPSVWYRMLDVAPTIGYIQLTRFSGESANEMATAIEALQEEGAQSLVLDLRNNGGGLLNAAVDIADYFISDGLLLREESNQDEQEFTATSETLAPDIPIVVLTNQGTASASEILAGALQDRDRATLIGNQSFGKGSVQLVFDLSDGSSIHVTSSRWFTPNGHQLDGEGLTPDIPVEMTQEAVDAGRDEILERAVTFLQNGE